MALKLILLMVIAAAAAKGCDLDVILEDLYDYTASEEDTSEEKPKPQQSTTASPTSPPPGGITSKPFPVNPMQNNANDAPAPSTNSSAPNNLSTPNNTPAANSTSRALNFKKRNAKGLHRRRSAHRRHVIRRIPLDMDALGRSTLTEMNNLFAGINQPGVAGRYAADSLGLPMRLKNTLVMKESNKEQKSLKLNHRRSDEAERERERESVLLIPLEELRSSIDRDSKRNTQKNIRRKFAEDHDRYDLDEILHLPVVKSLPNRHIQDHKRSSHKPSMVNRRPEHYVREELVGPLISLISSENHQSEEEEDDRDDEEDPVYLMVVSEALPEKDDLEDHDHVMLQLQNPRKPLIMHPDDLFYMEKLEESSPKKPDVDHINKVKEHIIRETTKINPVDRSEMLSIFDQFRESFLKRPKSPAEEDTVEDIRYKPVVLEESDAPEESQIFLALLEEPSLEDSRDKLEVLKLPTMNKPQRRPNLNKTQNDFQTNKKSADKNTQILVERPMVIIQEQPENNCKEQNCHQGSPIIITNSRVLIKNGKINEEMKLENSTEKRNNSQKNDEMRLKTGLLDGNEVDKLYHHSHSVPISYPINNPKNRHSPQPNHMGSEEHEAVIQEHNFYANPHDSKREEIHETRRNQESMMDHNEEMMHKNHMDGMNHEHQEMRPDHESMGHQNHDMVMNHEHHEMRPDHVESMSHQHHELAMNHEHQGMMHESPSHSMGHEDQNKPHEGSFVPNQEQHNMFSEQRLPLIDMINGFNGKMDMMKQHSLGHHDDGNLHGSHEPQAENSTIKNKIINAV